MNLNLAKHPCFDDKARHHFGRVHLPVAPKCNIQCNFCDRKNDCVAESRPGVTSAILSPGQALAYLEKVVAERPNMAVVGIAGPGDPFANPEETMETLRLVRERFPEMLLCVATNGLAVYRHIDELAQLQVSHVTITINAVDPQIGARIYAWVRDGVKILRGLAGAQLLLERQLMAVTELRARGIVVKVNTIVVPGVNEYHVVEVANTVAELGADILNCVALYPVENTVFAKVPSPTPELMGELRKEAAVYMPQMHHCTRCRADAVGLLGEVPTAENFAALAAAAALPLQPHSNRPYVAVISQEGVLINQHLGEARELLIYAITNEGCVQVDTRPAPASGDGDTRWEKLAATISDCRALLVNRAGGNPGRVLNAAGIRLVEMSGLIQDGVQAIYEGRRIPTPPQPRLSCAAGGCKGGGGGCG